MEFARKSLEERPAKEDYRNICYSNKWHISCSDNRLIHILQKPGERLLLDNCNLLL
ncbi:hypothetical protein J3F83DRAFT_729887 [Trichoderma novae-zelandiae]